VRAPSRLPALIQLTAVPLTRCHDERLFLRVLQASELCFLGLRQTVAAAIERIKARDPVLATSDIERAMRFSSLLAGLLKVLRTMPVEHFAGFRLNTGKASAIQSINFQLLDILLHGANTDKTADLLRVAHLKGVLRFCDSRFVSLRDGLRTLAGTGGAWDALADAAGRFDRQLLTWRGLHLSFAKTYIPNHGPGTGGTTGAAYLRKHLLRGLFDNQEPDWAVIEELFPDDGGTPSQDRVRPGVAVAP
jgi:tryptophan 2,3-dioxygenase